MQNVISGDEVRFHFDPTDYSDTEYLVIAALNFAFTEGVESGYESGYDSGREAEESASYDWAREEFITSIEDMRESLLRSDLDADLTHIELLDKLIINVRNE